MPAPLTIVLADDHAVFVDALTTVFSQLGHDVRAVATSLAVLIEKIHAVQPEVCVTGNRFSDGPVIDVLEQLVDDSPRTRIIMLTSDEHPETLRRALDAGAAAYLDKTRGLSALIETLRRVSAGEIVLEGSFSGRRPVRTDATVEFGRLAAHLTPRELECLALLARGLDTPALAAQLGVSTATVRTHVQALLAKLGVHSRLEAASMAVRHGLVSTTSPSENPDPSTRVKPATVSPKWSREDTGRGW